MNEGSSRTTGSGRGRVCGGATGLIAGGSIIGGVLGSRYGRKLPPNALQALIVVVGIIAIVRLV
jgi:uncharacterized membrane protein YfcA